MQLGEGGVTVESARGSPGKVEKICIFGVKIKMK